MREILITILAHLGAIAFGATVIFWAETALQVLSPWVWQAAIGIAMMLVGGTLLESVEDENGLMRAFEWFRFVMGTVEVILGLTIFLNFNRYEAILADTGPWPLYLSGGLIMLSGALLLIHSIASENTPASQKATT